MTELVRVAVAAMATRFEIVIAGADPHRLRAAGEAALAEIEACDAAWSRFRSDSEVSRLVRHASCGAVCVSWDFMDLLERCRAGWHATQGAFDVTAGSPKGVTMADVEVDCDARRVAFRRSDVRLDFGAIAKGVALDRAAALLRSVGVNCALLHGGTSSVVAIGRPAGRSGFRIVIPGGAEVCLTDEALSVSRTDSQIDDSGHSHIVDPLHQSPLTGCLGVSVVAPSGSVAEIWSTALLVNDRLRPPSGIHPFVIGSQPTGRFEINHYRNASRPEAEVSAHELPIAS